MLRRILLIVSVSLACIIGAQWIRSHWHRDEIEVRWTPGLHDGKDHSDLFSYLPGRWLSASSGWGSLRVEFEHGPLASRLEMGGPKAIYADWRWKLAINQSLPFEIERSEWLAFSIESPTSQREPKWAIEIPWWFLTLLPAGACVALLFAPKFRAAARLRRAALCPTCGYDLRASKEKCPECGSPIPPSAVSNHEK